MSGAWVDVATIKRRLSGVWVTVWQRITAFDASASDTASPAIAGVRIGPTGIQELREGSTYWTAGTWLAIGSAGDYEARLTITSTNGIGLNQGSAFATWLALSSTLEWRCTATSGNLATRDV